MGNSGSYDVAVIGSGFGGLTCGAMLAKAGLRVAVFEKHTKIGGYAHSFKRGPFTFESGIHSVPMGEGSVIDHMLRVLGVRDQVQTVSLPSTYHFSSPDLSYTLPASGEDMIAALSADFPGQRAQIRALFDDLWTFYDTLGRPLLRFEEEFTDEDTAFVTRFHNRSIADHISRFIDDERLRQVFYAMWPYAGKCPDRAPTVFYAVMLALHAFEGSHTVRGGFGEVARALASAITSRGGLVRTGSEVTALHVVQNRVRELVLASGERIEAGTVVSNISPYDLHLRLIPSESRRGLWGRRLNRLRPSVSSVISYLGLSAPATPLLPDTVSFWFATLDPAHAWAASPIRSAQQMDHLVLLSTDTADTPPTLTLMNFVHMDGSSDWHADKKAVSEAMLTKADQLYPGIRDLVVRGEAGSPDTFHRYTRNTGGAIYGFENDKDMYAEAKLPIKSYLDNLYQTGHWGKPGGGVWNVMHNAYRAAKTIERDLSASGTPRRTAPRRSGLTLRLIYPKFRKFLEGHASLAGLVREHVIGDYTMPPSLALPIIAALAPPDVEMRLTDDNIGQPVDFDETVDAVFISCFTPQASRAYALADEYRKRGTRVVLGGIHPSVAPQEAGRHADAVCVGEVEPVWDALLADLRAGSLKPLYHAHEYPPYRLEHMPLPKREIFNSNRYKWEAHLVLVSRGCPVRCAGCPIPFKEGTNVRLRPVNNVVEDIVTMPYKEFYITDDTVMLPGKKYTQYLLKLMERTAGLDINVFLAATMMMLPDPAFYRTLKAGGAASMYTVFGYDRVSRQLLSPECTPEEWQQGVDLVRMIEDAGIHFFASFGVGFDEQDEGVFDRVKQFAHDASIDLAEFYINTPFPGTPFGDQVEAEGRVLHRNYDLWNTGNVVFRPLAFTEERLVDGFCDLWNSFYESRRPEDTLRSFRHVNTTVEG